MTTKWSFTSPTLKKALAKEEQEERLEIERQALSGEFIEDMKYRLRGRKAD